MCVPKKDIVFISRYGFRMLTGIIKMTRGGEIRTVTEARQGLLCFRSVRPNERARERERRKTGTEEKGERAKDDGNGHPRLLPKKRPGGEKRSAL